MDFNGNADNVYAMVRITKIFETTHILMSTCPHMKNLQMSSVEQLQIEQSQLGDAICTTTLRSIEEEIIADGALISI